MSSTAGSPVSGGTRAARSASQKALIHVLENVFGLNKTTSGLWKALERAGFDKINAVISMSSHHIQALTYKGKDEDGIPADLYLNLNEEGLLEALKGFATFKGAHLGRPLTSTDWLQVTEEEFDDYQGSPNWIFFKTPHPSATGGLPSGTVTATNSQSQFAPEVLAFKRGIKRDQSLFPTYKDEKGWDDWQRRTRAQATAQCVENVLNPTYVPILPQDKELFLEQQKYMMAVFNTCVQTDYGKGLIRKFEGTHDAQSLFAALEQHAKSSTTALITSSQLLSYITTSILGKDTWNGSTTSFVLHWEEQVRLYESLVNVQCHFHADLKRTLLQNAVNGITDLRQVKLNADQLIQAGGATVSYQQYCDLLLNACNRYDAELLSPGHRVPSTRRTVYMTDAHYTDDGSAEFGFDTPLHVISAYRARMTGAQWHKLDPESQRIWDSLPDSAKEVILGDSSPNTRPHRRGRPGSRPSGAPGHVSARPPDRRLAQVHETYPDFDDNHDFDDDDVPDTLSTADDAPAQPDDHYIAMATNRSKPPPPAALQHMMSSSRARAEPRGTGSTLGPTPPSQPDSTRVAKSTRLVHICDITYAVSKHKRTSGESLIDRGANGGLAGADMRVITTSPFRSVHVEGIDNHQVRDVPIVTAAGILKTTTGEVIGIFHQYAHIKKGTSIHSSVQLEAYKQDVNDRSLRTPGGLQRILTVDGYEIPLQFRNGLPYMPLRPPTDHEFDTLPHVIMTSDQDWDPSILDCVPPDDASPSVPSSGPPHTLHDRFNHYGEYMDRFVVTASTLTDPALEDRILPSYLLYMTDQSAPPVADASPSPPADTSDALPVSPVAAPAILGQVPRTVRNIDPDFVTLQPFFAYQPVEAIKQTWHNSTQFARLPMSTHLKKHFKSPFPAHNVSRRNEPIATDTVFSNTPAVDNGATLAQFYVGTASMVCDLFAMKTDKQFVNTLEDIIRRRGAPTKLVSDHANAELSQKVLDILRSLCIDNWQSEAYHQHQNPAERRYQTVKRVTNTLMDRTGASADTWFLCMSYVCFVLNHTACKAINWQIPLRVLRGITPDISSLLRFSFYQPVYYAVNEPSSGTWKTPQNLFMVSFVRPSHLFPRS